MSWACLHYPSTDGLAWEGEGRPECVPSVVRAAVCGLRCGVASRGTGAVTGKEY